jgi:hypothetical protein
MRRVALSTLLAAATLAAPAAAQDPAAAPPSGAPEGTMALKLERVNGRHGAALSGTAVRVRGTVTPFVAGEKVTVRFFRGERKLRAKEVTVQPGPEGAGQFVLSHTERGAGRVVVRATHAATSRQATIVAKGVGYDVLPPRASPGSRGAGVRMLQRRLARHGYVVGRRGTRETSRSRPSRRRA